MPQVNRTYAMNHLALIKTKQVTHDLQYPTAHPSASAGPLGRHTAIRSCSTLQVAPTNLRRISAHTWFGAHTGRKACQR
eukprot:1161000-Pelagomonas_calceolata.AAC.9